MNNNLETQILKRTIQKELLNELCNKGVIDFIKLSNIKNKLNEDISKLKEKQNNNQDVKNIIIKIPV